MPIVMRVNVSPAFVPKALWPPRPLVRANQPAAATALQQNDSDQHDADEHPHQSQKRWHENSSLGFAPPQRLRTALTFLGLSLNPCFNDRDEGIRLQAGTTDQRTVHIRLRQQFQSVVRLHTAAVKNPRG